MEKIPPSDFGKARDLAAKMVGANRQYISDAKQIAKDAPEVLDHVKQGKLSIPQAKQVAALQYLTMVRRRASGLALLL